MYAKSKILWWAITLSYITLIYATLQPAPVIWQKIDFFLKGRAILLQYIVYSFLALAIFLYVIFKKKEKSFSRYFLFFIYLTLFFLIIKFAKRPAEKIHVAQYSLLGILVYRTLSLSFNKFGLKLYICGFLFCLIAGAIDELIQLYLPNRYFGWQDLFINGFSGVIMLLLIRTNILRKQF